MAFVGRTLYILGIVLLANSGYSSYQVSQLEKTGASNLSDGLPLDLKIEAILSAILLTLAALWDIKMQKCRPLGPLAELSEESVKALTSSPLKNIEMRKAMDEYEIQGFTPYDSLEHRLSFVNWAAKRAEYAKWLESQPN